MFQRTFVLTWLAYFGFYLCRKNFSVLMPYLKAETGLSSTDLANAIFLYSVLYAAGQFFMGRLADRVGARWVAGSGMLVSALLSALLAWPPWAGVALALAAVLGLNGLAQSTGWPSVLKLSRDWFPSTNRGVVMGWWSTHMVVGGFAGTWIATAAAQSEWTRAAWVPALLLTAIAMAYLIGVRDRPGIPSAEAAPGAIRLPAVQLVLTPALVSLSAMYFCVKMTRYSFLFWLPLYMTEHLGYEKSAAGYASSIYELIGFLGVLGAGYASERRGSSRFGVAAIMMAVLAVLCLAYPIVSGLGYGANLAAIALIGIFTFGPDTLMAGAAVQDIAPAGCTATAGGFVNSVGSLGQIVSPYAVAYLSSRYGWAALFTVLSVVVMCGAAALATQCFTVSKPNQEALS